MSDSNEKKPYDIEKIIQEQIEKNMDVLISLQEYDEGKKDISTAHLEKLLPHIRVR